MNESSDDIVITATIKPGKEALAELFSNSFNVTTQRNSWKELIWQSVDSINEDLANDVKTLRVIIGEKLILEINLGKLEHNTREMVSRCATSGIKVTGVVKGCSGIPECMDVMAKSGCHSLASSRLSHLEVAAKRGVDLPLMMIRIPGAGEAAKVISAADISLNSELSTLIRLNEAAGQQNVNHKVILMAELGDLREGFWDTAELVQVAVYVEKKLPNLELSGIGTNLGCYGSIAPTVDKMEDLVSLAESIEDVIGRKLEFISGGASTSFIRVMEGDMPERINHLRIGENILAGRDLRDLWEYNTDFLYDDIFTMKAEIIELKTKPSHPIGEISFNAFREKPVYEDRGMRKRAIIAAGRADYGFEDQLQPLIKGAVILGASSDHTIIDVEDVEADLKPGDFMEFSLCYGPTVFITHAQEVEYVFIK